MRNKTKKPAFSDSIERMIDSYLRYFLNTNIIVGFFLRKILILYKNGKNKSNAYAG
jgi:hypothetical protein